MQRFENDDSHREIEETQASLRKSIEESKRLAHESQQLLDKHRREPKGRAEA